jgi:hypothetical protein
MYGNGIKFFSRLTSTSDSENSIHVTIFLMSTCLQYVDRGKNFSIKKEIFFWIAHLFRANNDKMKPEKEVLTKDHIYNQRKTLLNICQEEGKNILHKFWKGFLVTPKTFFSNIFEVKKKNIDKKSNKVICNHKASISQHKKMIYGIHPNLRLFLCSIHHLLIGSVDAVTFTSNKNGFLTWHCYPWDNEEWNY